eukprot:scaffold4635_cov134-Skeletonema_dohrnii-CCMP3373.AAC.1
MPFSHPFRPASLVLSYSNFYIDYLSRAWYFIVCLSPSSAKRRSYPVAITSIWLPRQVLHSINDDVNLKASCRSSAISLDELEHLCSTLVLRLAISGSYKLDLAIKIHYPGISALRSTTTKSHCFGWLVLYGYPIDFPF